MRTAEDCAKQFRDLQQLDRSWTFALPIAAATATGSPGAPKVSIARFAALAGVSEQTIRRYLEAWDKAAAAGIVRPVAEMTPVDLDTFDPPERSFAEFYNSKAAGLYPKRVERVIELHGAEKVVAQLPAAVRADLAREIVRQSDPVEVAAVQRHATERIASEHVGTEQTRQQSHARQAADTSGTAFLRAEADLEAARLNLRSALNLMREVQVTEALQHVIMRRVGALRELLMLIESAATVGAQVDWDAELARLGADS